ncbi:MAG: O-antigen ligase family protein, partial [Candidatus Doudnabacteria bacterium]|nr:O-antigen ligase family protein [Candidatus Doudnabacteria bacterium]
MLKADQNLAYVLAAPLLLAGFALMLFFGFLGLFHFLLGLVLFFVGVILALRLKSFSQLGDLVVILVSLLIANWVFFSTLEIFPLLDVSAAVYAVLGSAVLVLAGRAMRFFPAVKWRFPLAAAAACYLATILLSIIFAKSPKEVIYFFFINALAIIIGYAVFNFLRLDSSRARAIGKAIFFFGAISALFAVWQLYSDSFKLLFFPYLAARDHEILQLWEMVSRVVGTWQHPSYLGIFLAVCVPLGLEQLFFERTTRFRRALLLCCLVLIAAVLLLSNTRSSVLAAGIGSIFLVWKLLASGDELLKRKLRNLVWLGAIGACALLLYQFLFVSEIYSKPQAYRVDASATIWGRFLRSDAMSTESLVQRSGLYELAIKTFASSPVVGVGAKNFQFRVQDAYGKATDAHNIFLQTLAEQGVLGFLALVFLYFGVVKNLFQAAWKRTASMAFTFSVTVLLIFFDSIFNNPLYSLRLVGIFWLFIASALAHNHIE